MTVKFFITPVYPYGDDHYYHEMISAAEGFEALGFKVIANADYWWIPEENRFLLNGTKSKEFDIAIYDYRYVKSFEHLLFRKGYPNFDKGKKHVLLDRNDWISPIWWKNPHYDIFDLILAGNLFQSIHYPRNVRPSAIGLTNRIMNYLDKNYSENSPQDHIIGYNFRVSHNMRGRLLQGIIDSDIKYPVESRFTDSISQDDIDLPEEDKKYWHQSSKRHNPAYFELLNKTLLFCSFGGYYETLPIIYQPYSFLDKIRRKPKYLKYNSLKKAGKDFSDEIFIFQHDNFRFWEVLYSGATAINLDLQYWGFWLPELPVSGEHYLGVKRLNADSLKKEINRLSPSEIFEISKKGRDFVIEHYSPKAQANRILRELGEK